MQVDKIEIGTVVDHIAAGRASKVMRLLDIVDNYPHRVAVMLNVPSKAMGTKDILKIEGKVVSRETANTLALVSPKATINIIRGGAVVEKYSVEMPKEIVGFGRCPNPSCISAESGERRFRADSGSFRCHYCERLFRAEELV